MLELCLSPPSCRNPALHKPYPSMCAAVCIGFLHPGLLYLWIKGCPSIVDLDISKIFDKTPADVAVDLMDQCGLVDNIAQWTGTWMKGSTQWMLIDWSPATWRAISCDLEGHVLASVLPNLSINDLDQNMESLLIKFADDIKQRGRQLTGPRSKMISTGRNNSLNLTRWNLIGINGESCPWVQRSTCTWDGEKWLNCNTWDKTLEISLTADSVGVRSVMWMSKNTRANQLHCFKGRVLGQWGGCAVAVGGTRSYSCVVLSVRCWGGPG